MYNLLLRSAIEAIREAAKREAAEQDSLVLEREYMLFIIKKIAEQDSLVSEREYMLFLNKYNSACSPQSKPSADVVDIVVNRSRVLCLFKILYHKYIFLNVNSIFDLVQVLLCEGLY